MSPPPDTRYPIEVFVADFQEIGRLTLPARDGMDTTASVLRYFTSQSKNLREAEWRMMRCHGAAAYWEKHKDHFNRGSLSVVGKETALISDCSMFALWVCWTHDDCDPLTYDPPIAIFIEVCEGLEKERKANAERSASS